MKNNPLNGYQPEYDRADAVADVQEHELETAKKANGRRANRRLPRFADLPLLRAADTPRR